MGDEQEKDQLKTTMAVGADWDWKSVQDVWERVSGLHDFFRKKNVQIEWVSRGSLFAAMQALLLECGGDIGLAKATLIDLVQISYTYVAGQLISAMQNVWSTGELDGQKLKPIEKARLKSNLDMLLTCIEESTVPMLSEEEIVQLREAQDQLATAAQLVSNQHGPEATLRAIGTMFVQAALFANGGDVMAAKASTLTTLYQILPVAIDMVQKLVQGQLEQASEGPAEGRPN